eukprot:TRINITY_DN7484_c0_g1_i1.p1 TRINITY_DN7484_c0_g1~~TRINITY_DN7484_c0_g1_i1.p1  ORF type:complete len:525 (+),score=54.63 TRINITY_DN7484_c0_g1_i1:126-1700(+)
MRRFTSPVSSSHQAKPSESPARPLLRSSDEAVTITRGSPGSSSEPVGSPTGLRDMRIEMVERPSRATTSEPQSQLGRSSSQSGTTGDTDAKLADALAQVAELTCQLALDRELNALLLEDNRNISQQLRDVTFERDQLLQRLHGSPAQRHGSPSAQRPSMLGSPTSRMVGSPALGARFASGVRRGSLDDSSRTHQLEAEIEQLKEFVLVQQREIAALHALAAREPRPLPRHDAAHPYSRSSSGSSGPHVDDGPSEAESAAAADTFAAFGVVDRPQPKEEVQALVREFSQISQHSSSRSLTGSSEGRFAAARSPSPDPARVRSPKAGAVTSTRAGAMVVEDFDLTEFDSPRPVVRRAAAGASPAQRPGSVEVRTPTQATTRTHMPNRVHTHTTHTRAHAHTQPHTHTHTRPHAKSTSTKTYPHRRSYTRKHLLSVALLPGLRRPNDRVRSSPVLASALQARRASCRQAALGRTAMSMLCCPVQLMLASRPVATVFPLTSHCERSISCRLWTSKDRRLASQSLPLSA